MLVRALVGATALLAAAGCASSSRQVETAEASEGEITCRSILVPGSNVEQRVCDTAEGWRDYERERTRASQELMRRMQGFGG
jgi:hypothetical protein